MKINDHFSVTFNCLFPLRAISIGKTSETLLEWIVFEPNCATYSQRDISIMSVTNDTSSSSLATKFLSIHDRHMACRADVRVWLYAHYFITLPLQLYFWLICASLLSLFMIIFIMFPAFRNFMRPVFPKLRCRSYADESKASYVLALLFRDIVAVVIYVSLAFLYEWFRSGGNASRIGSTKLRFWLVEATSLLDLLVLYLVGHVVGVVGLIFQSYQLVHLVLTAFKIPLFVCMRYIESHTDVSLRRLETWFVLRECAKIVRHRMKE